MMRVLSVLALVTVFGCATASDLRQDKVMAGEKAVEPGEGSVQFYHGRITVTEAVGKRKPVTYDYLRQHLVLKSAEKMETHTWLALKGSALREETIVWERRGTSEVFALQSSSGQAQGEATVNGGQDWKWSRWKFKWTFANREQSSGNGRVSATDLVIDDVVVDTHGRVLRTSKAILAPVTWAKFQEPLQGMEKGTVEAPELGSATTLSLQNR